MITTPTLPITPIFNHWGLQFLRTLPVCANAPQQMHSRGEAVAKRVEALAYSAGGLALNAAGTAGALAVLPMLGPLTVCVGGVVAIQGSSSLNSAFINHAGWLSHRAEVSPGMQRTARAVAWTTSHLAMGAALGLGSGVLPFLAPAQIAAGLAIGVGFPMAMYLLQLMGANVGIAAAPQGGLTPVAETINGNSIIDIGGGLKLKRIFQLTSAALTVAMTLPGWEQLSFGAKFFQFMFIKDASASAIVAASRAQQLAKHAEVINSASSSLLLSSAIITSALWGLSCVGAKHKYFIDFFTSGLTVPFYGHGLPRRM